MKGDTEQKKLLDDISQFLLENVRPYLNDMDDSFDLLKNIFTLFRNKKFFRIYLPTEYDGCPFVKENKLAFEEMMGQSGGALAFLQAQSSTALSIISQSSNTRIKNYFLNKCAEGEISIGNSVSHLKNTKSSSLLGINHKDRFKISGYINFASGWMIFDYILIGFRTAHDKEIFCVVPFNPNENLKVNKIHNVVGMNSLSTVCLEFIDYPVNHDDVVLSLDKSYFIDKYKNSIPYSYPLGLGKEALNAVSKSSNFNVFSKQYFFLNNELELCKKHLTDNLLQKTSDELFSAIICIAWKCIQFAILTCGGAGLLKEHTVQRLYRELPIWIIPRSSQTLVECLSGSII